MKQKQTQTSNQVATVVNHIRKAGSITRREAWVDHGIANLTAVMSLVRQKYDVVMTRKLHPVTLSTYAEYTIRFKSAPRLRASV